MKIIMDAIAYEQNSRGGIIRVFDEIIPRITNIFDDVFFEFLVSGKLKKKPPLGNRTNIKRLLPFDRILRPRAFWRDTNLTIRQIEQDWAVGKDNNSIWHSTYFTFPKKWRGPSVLTVHDMIYELFPQAYEKKIREEVILRKKKCIDQADAIICVSETTKSDLQNFYNVNNKRIFVIHNGYSEIFNEDPRVKVSENLSQNYLLYVGERYFYKNFQLLINAYSMWKQRGNFKLVIVGQPFSKKEYQMINKLGILDDIIIFSNISDNTLNSLYHNAYAFIYPSLYEGFGIPLLEASASGCPIIASDIPTTKEILKDIPFYFFPNSEDSLIHALEEMGASDNIHQRIIQGKENISKFSWDNSSISTYNAYKTLFGS